MSGWYGNKGASETALLFAEITPGESPPYVISHFGQDAYETYQLAVYFRDLIDVRLKPEHLDWTPGYRIMAKACAELIRREGAVAVEDFGSTLMAVVDKVEKAARWNGDDVASRPTYRGVEVSALLRNAAMVLHPDRSIEQATSWQDLSPAAGPRVTRCFQAVPTALLRPLS